MNTATQTQARPLPAKTPRVEYLTPLANILETVDGYILEVEMAGVTKEGVEVLVENGELTLSAGGLNFSPRAAKFSVNHAGSITGGCSSSIRRSIWST